jgi:hypothetical protein
MVSQNDLQFKEWQDEAQERLHAKNTAIMQSPSMFAYNQQKQNLIEKELDFSEQLESIERLLRCDVITIDNEGNQYWILNPDKDSIFLNNKGVNDVMRFIRTIINPNKILSYYTIEEINERVRQFKHEIRMMIYNNYELYGMDSEYKWNYYPMAVLSIGSTIEDTYRRALNGETHKGMTEQRIVNQSEALSNNPYSPQNMPSQPKRNLFNPFTWLRK